MSSTLTRRLLLRTTVAGAVALASSAAQTQDSPLMKGQARSWVSMYGNMAITSNIRIGVPTTLRRGGMWSIGSMLRNGTPRLGKTRQDLPSQGCLLT